MSQTIQFLADENFQQWIVKGLLRRQPMIDMITAAQAGTLGLPDPDVLTQAATTDRILVSHDVNTMPAHFKAFLDTGQHSPGLFLFTQTLPIAQAIEALHLVWVASNPDDWRDLMTYLP